jgi:hypothetical protein
MKIFDEEGYINYIFRPSYLSRLKALNQQAVANKQNFISKKINKFIANNISNALDVELNLSDNQN